MCAGQIHSRRRFFAGRTPPNSPEIIPGCKITIESLKIDRFSVCKDQYERNNAYRTDGIMETHFKPVKLLQNRP